MSDTNFTRINQDGSVTLNAKAAHCVLRLLAVADEDTRLALGLSRHEAEIADELYDELAACGVGGHADGHTPACYPRAA